MSSTRLASATLTACVLGVSSVVVAPAHADGQTWTPTVTAELTATAAPFDPPYHHGQGFYVSGSVTDPNGSYDASGGVAHLQVLTPANPVWTTIASDDSPQYLRFDAGLAFTTDAQYKVVFAGAPAPSAAYDTLLPAESAVLLAAVTRQVVIANPAGTSTIKGRISPDYARSPVRVDRRVGRTWRRHDTVRTSERSTFRFTLPEPRRGRTRWRITVPGGHEFTDWQAIAYTHSRTR